MAPPPFFKLQSVGLGFSRCKTILAYRLKRPTQPRLDGVDRNTVAARQIYATFALDVGERDQPAAVLRQPGKCPGGKRLSACIVESITFRRVCWVRDRERLVKLRIGQLSKTDRIDRCVARDCTHPGN